LRGYCVSNSDPSEPTYSGRLAFVTIEPGQIALTTFNTESPAGDDGAFFFVGPSPALPREVDRKMWRTNEDLKTFVSAFEALLLPKRDWTHAAHLTIGALYCLRYGEHDALERLRIGIRRLNESHGVENSDSHGYHETLTRFWLIIISRFLIEYKARHPQASDLSAIHALVERFGADSGFFRRFWTCDVTSSVEARRRWVAPDALPLDWRIDV
jgi:hypothetical protein